MKSEKWCLLGWATENGFEFDYSKCAVISFYENKSIEYPYLLDSQVLVRVNLIRDLGIYFDNSFFFRGTHRIYN